jgi:hypothetical protein
MGLIDLHGNSLCCVCGGIVDREKAVLESANEEALEVAEVVYHCHEAWDYDTDPPECISATWRWYHGDCWRDEQRLVRADNERLRGLESLKRELLVGGDCTILWFLPTGGAYVFPGDGRHGAAVRNSADLESYFCPSFTLANRQDLLNLLPGDGPSFFEGAREELYGLLFGPIGKVVLGIDDGSDANHGVPIP